jgi:hypothetical protein
VKEMSEILSRCDGNTCEYLHKILVIEDKNRTVFRENPREAKGTASDVPFNLCSLFMVSKPPFLSVQMI